MATPSPVAELHEMDGATGDVAGQKRIKRYCMTGIPDEVAALNYALSYLPTYLATEGLFRQGMKQENRGGDLYYFEVEFGPVPILDPGKWSFSFDTTGGTIHRRYSRECMDAYLPAGSPLVAAEQKKNSAIGFHPNTGQIDGTDVVIPVAKRTYTYKHPRGVVTESYADLLEVLTGIVNANPWHNRPAGEVLFLGAQGTTTVSGDAECTLAYQFAMSKNVTGASYGVAGWDEILNIDKDGHHFLDVVFEDVAGGDDHPNQKIQVIKIHRMYEELDFFTYLGF